MHKNGSSPPIDGWLNRNCGSAGLHCLFVCADSLEVTGDSGGSKGNKAKCIQSEAVLPGVMPFIHSSANGNAANGKRQPETPHTGRVRHKEGYNHSTFGMGWDGMDLLFFCT